MLMRQYLLRKIAEFIVRDSKLSFEVDGVNFEPFVYQQLKLDVGLKPWGEVGAATGLAGGANTFQVQGDDNQGSRNLSQHF